MDGMNKAYLIVAAAAVVAYMVLRSSPAVASSSVGGIVVNGRVFRPDANGYYRSDEGGVTRWLA